MKLDYDCIRDVLLFLEENLTLENDFSFSHMLSTEIVLQEQLTDFYAPQDIYYSIYNLYQCGFLEAYEVSADDVTIFSVYNITYEGHEFISHIRDNTFWKKLKSKLLDIKIENIPTIVSVAKWIAKQEFNM